MSNHPRKATRDRTQNESGEGTGRAGGGSGGGGGKEGGNGPHGDNAVLPRAVQAVPDKGHTRDKGDVHGQRGHARQRLLPGGRHLRAAHDTAGEHGGAVPQLPACIHRYAARASRLPGKT